MRKFLGFIAIGLLSCSAEPLPSDLELNNQNTNQYAFDWDSNQTEPYASFTLYQQGVAVQKIEHITDKHFEAVISNGQFFTFGVTCKKTEIRPEVSLMISRRKPMNLQSGVYKPEDYESLYKLISNTNAIGFNGRINEKGQLIYDKN